jgi:hypothetical protein
MGKDKFENEDLIKYGLPEDVWFHVDDLSSAHVYLRMKPGMGMDDISEDLLLDCSALVKANSIVGCKVSTVLLLLLLLLFVAFWMESSSTNRACEVIDIALTNESFSISHRRLLEK